MTLAAITDDSNLFAFDDVPVYVLIVIHFCHDKSLLFK